ncbi:MULTISPECIES: hypothetical protein [Achromobacter]|uniref:hypothetical protein n=1 Tax=Achromobacter TaxID=222 RepID=UPI00320B91E8
MNVDDIFQAARGGDVERVRACLAAGALIVRTTEAAGLPVTWNGSAGRRPTLALY